MIFLVNVLINTFSSYNLNINLIGFIVSEIIFFNGLIMVLVFCFVSSLSLRFGVKILTIFSKKFSNYRDWKLNNFGCRTAGP